MSFDGYIRVETGTEPVRVTLDGVTIAESASPRLLHEGNLPTRYYLPRTDVRMDLLEHSDTTTHCPYKGDAEYWSARVGDRVHADIAWSYGDPIPESAEITGLVAFPQERVDLYVAGVRQ